MKVVFFGTPEYAVPSLQAIIESKHEVVAVVSQPDKPVGRSNKLVPTPVKAKALEYGIKVFQYEKIRKEDISELLAIPADIYVTCAYGQILDEKVLFATKHGVINLHGSLLPKYRGASPVQSVLLGMEKETVEGTALADSDVKMQLKKATGIGALAAVTGRDQVLVSSFASQGGSLDNTTVTSYFLDHGEFTESGIVTYEMKIWVDADYVLPTTDVTDEDETDGLTHSNTTTSASYAFKIKAYAAQVL